MKKILYILILLISSILWGFGQYPSLFFLRFFGLIPFLYIIFYRKHYLIESLIFGWILYIINFYWLYITIRESGRLSIAFSLGIPLLLCLYYGLQYPIIAIIYKKFYNFNKILFYSFPFIFVFVDFLYPKLFKHTIVDSQIGFFYFVQLIDITGMTGLILIIMYFNLGLFKLLKNIITKQKISIYSFLFIIPLIIAVIYGMFRVNYLNKEIKKSNTIYAAMIQGNITGKQKMKKSYHQVNIERYNRLTKIAAEKNNIDLIIWPESVFTRGYDGTQESLESLIFEDYPPLILGITYWTFDDDDPEKFKVTNSCLFIKDRKEILRYDKKHLLAFGEYIPLEKSIPFLKKLTPLNYSMEKGNTRSIFKINEKVNACMSICFEDIFPDEIRKKVLEGCNLMVNMTNDSWYGNTMGPVHHSVLARLRAIENRRSFYRCTATGVTTASDFTGKVVAIGKVWEEQIVTARLPLYDKRTIYSYIGESLSYLSILIFICIFLYVLIAKLVIMFNYKKKI